MKHCQNPPGRRWAVYSRQEYGGTSRLDAGLGWVGEIYTHYSKRQTAIKIQKNLAASRNFLY